MQIFTRDGLHGSGFDGFVPLLTLEPSRVPRDGGVYVVLRESETPPQFAATSIGGWFKGRDPSNPINDLVARWRSDAPVVYIGKATSLRTRLRQYRDFGRGKPIGHWGGRYIWQLADADQLLACWRPTDELPRDVEKQMLEEFRATYGAHPFANLSR